MHDSSICIFENGKILNFFKEERITKKKRDSDPIRALYEINFKEEPIDFAYSTPTQNNAYYQTIIRLAQKNFNINRNSFIIKLLF